MITYVYQLNLISSNIQLSFIMSFFFEGCKTKISKGVWHPKVFDPAEGRRLGKDQGSFRRPPKHLFSLPQVEVPACCSEDHLREKLVDASRFIINIMFMLEVYLLKYNVC